MSMMTIDCPWCGVTYTFGVVGSQVFGGHDCQGDVKCQYLDCKRRGNFLVEGHAFCCEDHIEGRTILGVQPGVFPGDNE